MTKRRQASSEDRSRAGKAGKAKSPWRHGNLYWLPASKIRAIGSGFDPNMKEKGK